MKEIIIFTDGAYKKSTKRAGYGIYYPNKEFEDVSEEYTLEPITNNRAELYAIYIALFRLSKSKTKYSKITIYSDSEYSIKSVSLWIKKWEVNNWKTASGSPVKNDDIIIPISKLLHKLKHVEFKHVRSHTGLQDEISIGNSVADRYADLAALK